jgi:hypothetical protein
LIPESVYTQMPNVGDVSEFKPQPLAVLNMLGIPNKDHPLPAGRLLLGNEELMSFLYDALGGMRFIDAESALEVLGYADLIQTCQLPA